jgi:hypothetical protein
VKLTSCRITGDVIDLKKTKQKKKTKKKQKQKQQKQNKLLSRENNS